MKRKWFDKKVLIAGLSKSGTAAARYLNSKGAECFVTEFKPADEKSAELVRELESEGIHVETGGHSDEFIENSTIAVTSPSVPLDSPIMKKLQEKNIKVISNKKNTYNCIFLFSFTTLL